jgi:NADH-quinone oxidoreductase subunit L
MIAWFNGGQMAGITWGPGDKPIEISFKWLPIGAGVSQDHPGFLDLVVYVDSLSIALFNAITLVALLARLYAMAAMSREKAFSRFFACLDFLIFASLGLVLSGSLLQMFIFWQLLSVGGYVLDAFRHETLGVRQDALRIFAVGAAADVGFFLALVIVAHLMGNLTLSDLTRLLRTAPEGTAISGSTQTLLGLLLVISAAGKAGLFPLRRWPASAAHAPPAASALLQSVAGGAAGIYLIARVSPILGPSAFWVIALAGLIAMTLAALLSAVQTDIDQVLAMNTLSQLGLMFLALGVGSWIGALFQLLSHIFFKSLLFLSAGNVIRAGGDERELGQFGGVLGDAPLTAMALGIGALAAAGAPFTSGYFSQEMVLTHAGAFAVAGWQNHRAWCYWIFFALPMFAIGVSAFALMRCWMLIFWGKPRAFRERAPGDPRPLLWVPMAALAGLSIVGGSRVLEIKPLLAEAVSETEHFCFAQEESSSRPSGTFLQAWPVDVENYSGADADETRVGADPVRAQLDASARLFRTYFPWSLATGLALGFVIYLRGFAGAELLLKFPPLRWIHSLLTGRVRWDELRRKLGVAEKLEGVWQRSSRWLSSGR